MNEHVLKVIEIMPGTNEIDAKEIEFIFASTLADLKDRCNVDKFTDGQMERIYYIVAMTAKLWEQEKKFASEFESSGVGEVVQVGDTTIKTSKDSVEIKTTELNQLRYNVTKAVSSFVVNNRKIRW